MLELPDRGAATRLLLDRHAETDASARGTCYGRLDVPLSSEGRRRAEALGAALAALPVAAVYSSPLLRALDTAAALAASQGLEAVVDHGLREIDFGELEGLSYDVIRAERRELFRRWMEHPTEVTFPGGEGFAELRDRVVLAEVLELPEGAIFRLGLDFGGITVVDWLDGSAVVRAVNAVLYSRA
jgi:broad specificity phosphatase PhoE